MQTTSLAHALLVLVFRCSRLGRQANLTVFSRRQRVSAEAVARCLGELEQRGLIRFSNSGERLTLEGLALAAALARAESARRPPLAACRRLAA